VLAIGAHVDARAGAQRSALCAGAVVRNRGLGAEQVVLRVGSGAGDHNDACHQQREGKKACHHEETIIPEIRNREQSRWRRGA
jgi:hypothetical protein